MADQPMQDAPHVHHFGRVRPDELPVPFYSFRLFRATDVEGQEHIFWVPTAATPEPAGERDGLRAAILAKITPGNEHGLSYQAGRNDGLREAAKLAALPSPQSAPEDPCCYSLHEAEAVCLRTGRTFWPAAPAEPAGEPTPEEVREYRLDATDPENARLNREEWLAHRRLAEPAGERDGLRAALERADREASLIHDAIYAAKGLDEAERSVLSDMVWTIHAALRPLFRDEERDQIDRDPDEGRP